MIIFEEDRPPDSPFVEHIWRCHSDGADPLLSMGDNLIDEYQLNVAPSVLGKGKRLFHEGRQAQLQLVDTKPYMSGMLRLIYQPPK